MGGKPLRFNKHFAPWAPFVLGADFLWGVFCAFAAAYCLGQTELGAHLWPWRPNYFLLALTLSFIQVALMEVLGSYRPGSSVSVARGIVNVFISVFLTFVLFSMATYLAKSGAKFSRLWVGVWFALVLVGQMLLRSFLVASLKKLRLAGWDKKAVLLVGNGDNVKKIAELIASNANLGLEVSGVFTDDERCMNPSFPNVEPISALFGYLDVHYIDQVWLVQSEINNCKIKEIVDRLDARAIDVRLVPDILSYRMLNHSIESVMGVPVINLSASPQTGLDGAIKRIIDVLGASILLILLSPLFVLISVLIRLDSVGKVIYLQQRHGWDGRPFNVLKFRTMYMAPEPEKGAYIQAVRNDARVTRIGHFLRRTSMDELPQLINVLKGEMSLVGPRPHPVKMSQLYMNRVDRYMARHKVKPGITGWAQINGLRGPTETDEKIQLRIQYDLFYIENWSILLDVKILFMTLVRGLFDENAI